MTAEWIEVQDESILTRVAMVEGYGLTVIGGDDLWAWFIDLNGRNVTEGMERDLAVAMNAAENAAHRLAGGPGAR